MGDGGSAKVQIGRRPWKGAKVRVQSTDYRLLKYEDADFPVPGFPFRLYAVGLGRRHDLVWPRFARLSANGRDAVASLPRGS